jgi:hypothetical protein
METSEWTSLAQKVEIANVLACEAGESIKPGASAPGQGKQRIEPVKRATASVFHAFARCRGLGRKTTFTWG